MNILRLPTLLIMIFSFLNWVFCQTNNSTSNKQSNSTNSSNSTSPSSGNSSSTTPSTTQSSITNKTPQSNVQGNQNEQTYSVSEGSYHCDDSKLTGFKRGDWVFVCVHILPRQLRMAFNISVDTYEMLSITGGYIFAASDSMVKPSFLFQFGNISTAYSSMFLNKENKQVTTLFNVVIKLDKGKIADVVWDNDCWDCALSSSCQLYNKIPSLRNKSEVYSENVINDFKAFKNIYKYIFTNLELCSNSM